MRGGEPSAASIAGSHPRRAQHEGPSHRKVSPDSRQSGPTDLISGRAPPSRKAERGATSYQSHSDASLNWTAQRRHTISCNGLLARARSQTNGVEASCLGYGSCRPHRDDSWLRRLGRRFFLGRLAEPRRREHPRHRAGRIPFEWDDWRDRGLPVPGHPWMRLSDCPLDFEVVAQ
jgi:hypothetical protein